MDFTQAQIGVVKAVIATFPGGEWQAAILDCEILEMPDGFDLDFTGIILMKDSAGHLVQDQFYLDAPARQDCCNLYLQRKRAAGDIIAGFQLRIQQPGTYRFTFKDKVKRLNGVWDAEAETYLDNYLAHYQRETSAGNQT